MNILYRGAYPTKENVSIRAKGSGLEKSPKKENDWRLLRSRPSEVDGGIKTRLGMATIGMVGEAQTCEISFGE